MTVPADLYSCSSAGRVGPGELDRSAADQELGRRRRGGGLLAAARVRRVLAGGGGPDRFWRLPLHNCPTKHYDATAGKALPAMVLGVIARVGSVAGHRFGLPPRLARHDSADPSAAAPARALVDVGVQVLEPHDLSVTDREFTMKTSPGQRDFG